ncbi:DUF305 domain-containing protein [Caballeronia sp. LZ062]|uniref:CopM family metallochaperone n=1 Tax=unclassified Caballeronia TaxID=2646786 RepID=UPI00285E650F|nr:MULTISPECIES: DUF305 domain-containing protein [unclassified Caballeronia]MDR5854769.1 DUF305 domain-containing protein [Caballeronia sp. LZ050]MDR5870702.1 DUF305 domain-containing protein [Caballeronia sp. LZ062]
MKSTSKLLRAILAVFTVSCSVCGFAQTSAASHGSMPGMELEHGTAQAADAPSTAAFEAADKAMMAGMAGIPYTGNADRDFVAHMTPHHEGAIEMAKVELKYGKDAKLRKLAKEIIAAQEKEIAFMKRWLASHP